MVDAILYHVAEETAGSLLHMVVKPAKDNIKRDLRKKADEILEPHLSGHPITYNHYLQKVQADRRRRQIEGRLKQLCSLFTTPSGVFNYSLDMSVLLGDLAGKTEPDMDTYSCPMAVDTMEAYYKVGRPDVFGTIPTTDHTHRSRSRRLLTRLARWLSRDAYYSSNCPPFFPPMLRASLPTMLSSALRVRAPSWWPRGCRPTRSPLFWRTRWWS